MIHDDGIEVYLKPGGDDEQHLRRCELEEEPSEDGKYRQCHVLVGNEDLKVVIRFGETFRLFTADCIHVVIALGDGLYLTKPSYGNYHHKDVVQGHQLVWMKLDDERLIETPLIDFHSAPPAVEGGLRQSCRAPPGSVAVFIVRGKATWEYNTDMAIEARSSLQMIDKFRPLKSATGKPYVFTFWPRSAGDLSERARCLGKTGISGTGALEGFARTSYALSVDEEYEAAAKRTKAKRKEEFESRDRIRKAVMRLQITSPPRWSRTKLSTRQLPLTRRPLAEMTDQPTIHPAPARANLFTQLLTTQMAHAGMNVQRDDDEPEIARMVDFQAQRRIDGSEMEIGTAAALDEVESLAQTADDADDHVMTEGEMQTPLKSTGGRQRRASKATNAVPTVNAPKPKATTAQRKRKGAPEVPTHRVQPGLSRTLAPAVDTPITPQDDEDQDDEALDHKLWMLNNEQDRIHVDMRKRTKLMEMRRLTNEGMKDDEDVKLMQLELDKMEGEGQLLGLERDKVELEFQRKRRNKDEAA